MNYIQSCTKIIKMVLIFIPLLLNADITSDIIDNYIITSLFGGTRADHFHTGIDLFAIKEPVKAYENSRMIFHNTNRVDSIRYGNGNVAILQNDRGTKRYNYSHLEDNTIHLSKSFFSSGDIIGLTGNSGRSTGYHLHFEIEDMANRKIDNPLSIIDSIDTIRPVIQDVFFITLNEQNVSLMSESRLIRGGKLFVKTYDIINGTDFKQPPYEINVFINGKPLSTIRFDGLEKKDNDYYVSNTDKNFYSVYPIASGEVYFMKEKYFLPGLYGIKVESIDYHGNKSTFTKSFRVLPPQKENK